MSHLHVDSADLPGIVSDKEKGEQDLSARKTARIEPLPAPSPALNPHFPVQRSSPQLSEVLPVLTS